ncbi:hypothetical protein [Streptacidiphilus jiangxiensis]|uniref:Uncharacterized protein n=1 Tax=Streptacidiphilus jiangxiensis TaxID=235985 RepID=A0A1H8ABF3_STRJI|nr:hypothetical protein [Streptacidiphilus jiangxiensis]SEM68212.1 hypothetical protein SAMN05414137_14325 [Streptacidiphilus jiangxiensis]
MTSRRRPYIRIEIGQLTLTVQERPTWRRAGKVLAAVLPLSALAAGSAVGWLGRLTWR